MKTDSQGRQGLSYACEFRVKINQYLAMIMKLTITLLGEEAGKLTFSLSMMTLPGI